MPGQCQPYLDFDPVGPVTYTSSQSCSSPMFPTPRRALFTTAAMMDALEGRGKPEKLRDDADMECWD